MNGKHRLFLLVSLLLLACNVHTNPDIKNGSELYYVPGYPEVSVYAVGYIAPDGQPYLKVMSELVFGSLIYKKQNEVFVSKVGVEIKVKDKSDGRQTRSIAEEITITEEKRKITESEEKYTYVKRLPVPLGNYNIQLTTTDLFSGKTVTRETNAFISGTDADRPSVSNIELLAKDMSVDSTFRSLSTYHVAGKYDSVKFRFQVSKNKNIERLTIQSILYKFRSDTSYARRLGAQDYRRSNIEYIGLDYGSFEMVNTNRRILLQKGNVFVEINFPMLERGNYRFEITLKDGEEVIQQKARDFGVKSANFPNLLTARELARPLVYLMDKDRYKQLLEISDSKELKSAIDKFWVSEMKNTRTAGQVIAAYYERVVQANKKFSNFKEGWKTDRGMVYILFGPPWYEDRTATLIQWGYSYNKQRPDRKYIFERVRPNNATFPFNHYIVDRKFLYNTEVYKQIDLWKHGQILENPI